MVDQIVFPALLKVFLSAYVVSPDFTEEKRLRQVAEVIAVGSGEPHDGKNPVAVKVKVGDKVLISKYSGTEVKLEGEKYTIVRQNDILAIVE
jgi:chaperonin GroES